MVLDLLTSSAEDLHAEKHQEEAGWYGRASQDPQWGEVQDAYGCLRFLSPRSRCG